jgi:hypothetical protein
VFGRLGSNAGAWCCRTRLQNAHGIVFRELLYPWYPWSTLRVAVHEVIGKVDGEVFRCTLSGLASDRWLEVPAWQVAPVAPLTRTKPNPIYAAYYNDPGAALTRVLMLRISINLGLPLEPERASERSCGSSWQAVGERLGWHDR